MFVGALIGFVTPGVKYVCWCFDCHRHTGVKYVCWSFDCHRHTGVNMFVGALIVNVTPE